jgi:hypothetical protein
MSSGPAPLVLGIASSTCAVVEHLTIASGTVADLCACKRRQNMMVYGPPYSTFPDIRSLKYCLMYLRGVFLNRSVELNPFFLHGVVQNC